MRGIVEQKLWFWIAKLEYRLSKVVAPQHTNKAFDSIIHVFSNALYALETPICKPLFPHD